MALGTVKWFDRKKGYGFIVGEVPDQDVFVHYSSIEGEGFRSLKHGDKVEYELVESERGPQGRHVRRVKPAEKDAGAEAGSRQTLASPTTEAEG